MPKVTKPVVRPTIETAELLKALAATALDLHHLLALAGDSNHVQLMRREMANIRPGDIVLDIREWWQPAEERIGVLHQLISQSENGAVALVKIVDGRLVTWRRARLIKIPEQSFNPGIGETA